MLAGLQLRKPDLGVGVDKGLLVDPSESFDRAHIEHNYVPGIQDFDFVTAVIPPINRR